jgi:hypothetical protein
MSGIPAGETAYIRGEDGTAILSYRSFASVIGLVAALMSAIVVVAGVAGTAFLLFERRPLPALAGLVLSAVFAAVIIMLIPATEATVFDGASPAITISQQPGLHVPIVTYAVETPDGSAIGRISKSFLSRLGRNRWRLLDGSIEQGEAIEESLVHAWVSKALGKFAPAFQSNIRITWKGEEAGWIIRRPGTDGQADLLTLNPATTLDRRVALALAVLVLGSEP